MLLQGERIGLECKKAATSVPDNIWTSYSAFANTYGGIILLGIQENIKEKDIQKRFTIIGVEDSDKIVKDLWNQANNPQKIKMYGRMVKNYNDKVWNGIRAVVLYEGLLAKFSQNEAARQFLLSTGDAVLCECAKNDLIWGNGMDMNDPERLDMSKWRGESLLGFILMKVREKIK